MKTNPPDTSFFGIAVAIALLIPLSADAASKVTFDNQSGKPALVKLVGPTSASISVENGSKESLSVGLGHYFIKIRYGTPGAYTYSKGDEFDVTETATSASHITITLHKVVAGNYGSNAISESEFGTDDGKEKPAEKLGWRKDPVLFVKEVQRLVDDGGLRPEQAIKKLLVGEPTEIEWRGRLFSIWPASPFTGPAMVEIQMDGLVVRDQKKNDYRISRIGLLPTGDEWKKWGELYEETKSLPGNELSKRQVIFKASLLPEPVTHKCGGLPFLGLVADRGRLAVLASHVVCLPENSPEHCHIGLTIKGGELVERVATDALGKSNASDLRTGGSKTQK
ncbi:MAG: hypothetical protein NTY01_10475 [Verrucomicrobia bacterium]|nr:hypothetical protein [Verrucomicrobiota bacterium]